ncbi:selenocysteine-specific translation elongation factor [Alkalihalobacillus sp. BA299]|uniref:selenocysteine-specific translation elongation factor n=1 Tax=Alkalihalobacillus sp. BA299 TaxID=2815938 RepID=UPI0027DDD387|nr:selenocysteine-specific translation elongation factor [Alkalihalobacillus sp. BA299]
MTEKFYTIGMAGHIDHGKTALTKALTNIDTDRLKEEKERSISIELGYAPLRLNEDTEVTIIDVPGHERFIRQMIAGVAGIDMVMLIVAADEGVMPQTKEHIDILSFLGIEIGLIVVTKVDRVNEDFIELVKEDITSHVKGTFLENAPFTFVNNLTKAGIPILKETIMQQLVGIQSRSRFAKGAFRLPIDQVFSVHGQGTVVRGTAYEGTVKDGDILEILPQGERVRVRQIQVNRQQKRIGHAGQRIALNLSGITKEMVHRGNVLVTANTFSSTQTIDVVLNTVKDLKTPLKQRAIVKVHIGTAEVLGNIVFFDRNQLEEQDKILCQIRLNEPVVTKRGDHLIIRRPSPAELIGGGCVIDAFGKKYRFGLETVKMLAQKNEGGPEDRIINSLTEQKVLSVNQLVQQTNIILDSVVQCIDEMINRKLILEIKKGHYMTIDLFKNIINFVHDELEEYHINYPMREGKNKAEIIQTIKSLIPQKFAEIVLEKLIADQHILKKEQFLTLKSFEANYPIKWGKRIEGLLKNIECQGIEVDPWDDLFEKAQLPKEISEDLKYFLRSKGEIYLLDDKYPIHKKTFEQYVNQLFNKTGDSFTLKEAKDIVKVSRKYIVPFLELLDIFGVTVRNDNSRKWSLNYLKNSKII